MRSNIKCDAEKCMHNCDGLCDAAVVHVRDGKGNSQSARCTTYAYRISNSGSRLLMEMGEDMSLDRHDKDEDIPIAATTRIAPVPQEASTYFLPVTAAIINAPATPTNRNKKTVANFFPLCYNIFC